MNYHSKNPVSGLIIFLQGTYFLKFIGTVLSAIFKKKTLIIEGYFLVDGKDAEAYKILCFLKF